MSQGVYVADAYGIVHTDTEPLQDNPHYNQEFDTSKLFFLDPYNNEENYHAHTQHNEDHLITPDQHSNYDTIGYDDGYGYPNEQHPNQHSRQSLAMAFEAWESNSKTYTNNH